MEDVLSFIIFGTLFVLPIALVALDFVFFIKKKERPIFELIAFGTGGAYMILAYMLWDLPPYDSALNIYGMANVHEPFNSEHLLTLVAIAVVGFFGYYILKFSRKALPPLLEVILLGGMYAGCILSLVWIFQLICGGWPEGMSMDMLDAIEILCLCSVPGLFLVHAIQMLVLLVKEKAEKQETIHYENQFLQTINLWFVKGANLFWMAVIVMLPILAILIAILCLFGQQPDSVILAFTKTSDWILSKEIAPPPVAYDTHYLCTVSLRGHKRLVKPIRYGIRRGEKIVVNRQLCVANAFEQLLMERTPRFHKAVRNFYDTYGYPISRHINSAWTADITYLIMKPLEWLFLGVLYLFDESPEDRICRQYLPTKIDEVTEIG
ncbi:MAG: hypothetical protein IJ409_08090 [Lachnospiraceae bacterium]|nr:hypothetical protein [Lachnospiraceae bacterium]